MSLGADLSFGAQFREPVAIDRLNATFPITIEDQSARDKTRSQSRLQRPERAKESIDRTARCASRGLIDPDGEKAAVLPISGGGEGRAVRVPLREKAIDVAKKKIGG